MFKKTADLVSGGTPKGGDDDNDEQNDDEDDDEQDVSDSEYDDDNSDDNDAMRRSTDTRPTALSSSTVNANITIFLIVKFYLLLIR